MMDNQIVALAFKLNEELIKCLNTNELLQLEHKFGMHATILKEIHEILSDVDINLRKTPIKITKEGFEIFEYNEGGYGMEVKILTKKGEETDLTWHSELHQSGNEMKLRYRLIEVM